MIIIGPNKIPHWLEDDVIPYLLTIKSFREKLYGLYAWKDWGSSPRGLVILNCNAVHTLFLTNPIDIIYLNYKLQIIDLKISLSKNKIIVCRKASHVIELPANYCRTHNWQLKIETAIENLVNN